MSSSGMWRCVNRRLQPPAHAGSSLADVSTLKMEAICSSETQDLHSATSKKYDILQNTCCLPLCLPYPFSRLSACRVNPWPLFLTKLNMSLQMYTSKRGFPYSVGTSTAVYFFLLFHSGNRLTKLS
jgi:hypothetical protein